MFAGDFIGKTNAPVLDGDREPFGGTPHRSHLLLRKRPWASGPFSPEHVLFSRGVHIGMVAPMASGRTVRIIKSLQRE